MSKQLGSFINILREIIINKNREPEVTIVQNILQQFLKWLFLLSILFIFISAIGVLIAKHYEASDDDEFRGAIAVDAGWFNENYEQPIYLKQGWQASDSLWFYNTTQGSGLLPYDFFVSLEQEGSQQLINTAIFIDKYRYLPQKATEFNPDALPVGFVQDEYKDKHYLGFTCAACHTGQVNYANQAIRIDGGPSMANMVNFLHALEKAMKKTIADENKLKRFTTRVLGREDSDYDTEDEVIEDLRKWTSSVELYNTINHVKKSSEYGYARLDAFGRIYNRVLQHVINSEQAAQILAAVVDPENTPILTKAEIINVLQGMNKTIMRNDEFNLMLTRLQSNQPGFPNLNQRNMLRVKNKFFNPPDAPVSYPFLWDIAQSDYVQWNGLASNGNLGPLGRNAGEVIGVFGILDWEVSDAGFSLAAKLSGQDRKATKMNFNSSINLHNLGRLESRLKTLKSPLWENATEELIKKGVDVSEWQIDKNKARKGKALYEQYCQSCHELIDRNNWDRIMVAKMSSVENVGTDPTMAMNGVKYQGYSGNFKDTYQDTPVGKIVINEQAPVVQILTSATTGVVATPDSDKSIFRRLFDWVYTIFMSLTENSIEASIKSGDYSPDTTQSPYSSLLSYKARSLNGIWATAPYLHNGSVPSLYDLLLPARGKDDPVGDEYEYRPDTFKVGKREFDPIKVGFIYTDFEGFEFKTQNKGNSNKGHEYAAGRTEQPDGKPLPALDKKQRAELLEFLKTL